jgi:hypothetical protein
MTLSTMQGRESGQQYRYPRCSSQDESMLSSHSAQVNQRAWDKPLISDLGQIAGNAGAQATVEQQSLSTCLCPDKEFLDS